MAKGCLQVVQRSRAGEASLAIQADLERLIEHGLVMPKAPDNSAVAPFPAASPLLSRNGLINPSALVDQDDTIAMQATSTPATPVRPSQDSTDTAAVKPSPDARSSPIPDPMEISDPKSVAESTASAPTYISDAFEGALEGLDFGVETLGVDSLAWFTNYDLGGSGTGQDEMLL
jgi:hypothetical protein